MAQDDMAGAQTSAGNLLGGSNQSRVRAYNERLVLSLVRRLGHLSKAEIARHTGLSPQTVSVIMRSLEQDGLLMRGEPRRGKVGQPSIPMSLNPTGVFSLGLKIGRRSADLVLMDFTGAVKLQFHEAYLYPTPSGILAFVRQGSIAILDSLSVAERERIAGLGVALPFELWNWVEAVGAPSYDLDTWRHADIAAMLSEILPFPVFLQNDATAACAAELALGNQPNYSDFAYFFLGSFVGGGVVLNHALFPGRAGNAGAFGSMPMRDEHGRLSQLIDHASIVQLEKMVIDSGRDPSSIWLTPETWADFGPVLDAWIDKTGMALAHATAAACSVIDFEAIIIDGGFSRDIRRRIVASTRYALAMLDLQGLIVPRIEEGRTGSSARAIGAACLPLFSRYHIDQSVLLKDMADG